MLKGLFNKIKIIKRNRKEVKIGKNTRILTSWLNFGSEPYLIEIGDNCTITSGVKFITHDASIGVVFNYLKKNREELGFKYEKIGKIKIGNNCMIGINTIVLPGVEIGANSIIGAGSIVTRDVPPNSVVGGNPAVIICNLDIYCKKIEKKLIKIEKKNRKKNIIDYFIISNI